MVNTIKYLSILLVVISVKSVADRLSLPFPMGLIYIVDFSTIVLLLYLAVKNGTYTKPYTFTTSLFLVWVIIGFIRGLFAAEDYWLVKNLITNTKSLLLPLCVYSFCNPFVPLKVLRTWNKFILYFFVIIFLKFVHDDYAFILPPFYYLYVIFLPFIKGKWFWITIFTMIIIGTGLENRSAVLKLMFSMLLMISVCIKRYIPVLLLRFGHVLFFVLPIVFFVLGVTGQFNIFKGFPELKDTRIIFSSEGIVDNGSEEESITNDTRTFMYEEALLSAKVHDYFIIGRSLSRGNDSATVGAVEAKMNGFTRMERNYNEANIVNVFTWLGVVGFLLLTFVYLHSSVLALYCSNNFYIQCLGLSVAFHWAYSWIEEAYTFSIMDFVLWFIISICFSPQFRKMSNLQFENWIVSLFSKNDFTLFHKDVIIRRLSFISKQHY